MNKSLWTAFLKCTNGKEAELHVAATDIHEALEKVTLWAKEQGNYFLGQEVVNLRKSLDDVICVGVHGPGEE